MNWDELAVVARAALASGVRLRDELARACLPDILAGARLIVSSLERGGKVLLFGNGGSAADAQHISAELVGRYVTERTALPAIALTVDTSTLTSIANDYGFERVFARQVEALARPGDVVVAISTSGRSANVLAGAAAARSAGAAVVALAGADGGPLRAASDVCVEVPARTTARIQECHITIGHIWCEIVDAVRAAEGQVAPATGDRGAPGKIIALDDLVALRGHLRRQRQSVVWTNGCFDVLHAGHVASLRAARGLGDWLVVGLNSDASVRRLKGPGRPVFAAAERAEVLAALSLVDLVTVFDDDTPVEIVGRLQPDVCCKGEDYDPDKGGKPAPEADTVAGYGGRMVYLPLRPGLSTTAALARAPRRRGLFLDRDGTLMVDTGYPRSPGEVALLPGVAATLRPLAARGFALVLVSNQSGVGRGLLSSDDLRRVHGRLEELLGREGVRLDASYYCEHAPDDGCACRKPSPLLLRRAADELGLDLGRSIMVGDSPTDVEAGRAAGCRTVLLGDGEDGAAGARAAARPDFVARSWPDVLAFLADSP